MVGGQLYPIGHVPTYVEEELTKVDPPCASAETEYATVPYFVVAAHEEQGAATLQLGLDPPFAPLHFHVVYPPHEPAT